MGEFKLSCHLTTLGKGKQVMQLNSFGGNSHTKHCIITSTVDTMLLIKQKKNNIKNHHPYLLHFHHYCIHK